MDKKNPPIVIGVLRTGNLLKISLFAFLLALTFKAGAQNPKIKCYFNHPVNNAVSTGTNAISLNTAFVDTLIAYINRATISIDLCVYNYYITSGDGMNAIATAINAAYSRGVKIRWIGNGSSSNNGWANLNAGIKTVSSPTTSAYGISHNKFVVFDESSSNANVPTVWTGSYNFSRQQNDFDYNNVVIIQDKSVATAYYNEFNQMWGSTTTTPNSANSKFGPNKVASAINTFTVNGTPIEVYFSPKDATASHLQTAIGTANNELCFGIYTFTDNTTATVIKNKINAGVAAFGIMDQFSNTYTPYATLNPVMTSNLKVYSNANYVYHNKIMLIDALHPASDPQVCTGSFNWSASATTKNDENMVIIHDATIANEYYQSLCKNFTDVGGTACAALGVEDFDFGHQQIAVYPNPAKDLINIKVKNCGDKLKVTLTNSLGQVISEKSNAGSDEASFDISTLTPGLYFITVFRGDKTFAEKFLKQ